MTLGMPKNRKYILSGILVSKYIVTFQSDCFHYFFQQQSLLCENSMLWHEGRGDQTPGPLSGGAATAQFPQGIEPLNPPNGAV